MVRKAVKEDIRDIMQVIKATIEEMRTYNNTQWDENYPREEDFMSDIEKGELFAVDREGKLAGFVCINKIEPIEYNELNWLLNKDAMVVHRMAVNPNCRRSGIGTELMKFADDFALKNSIKHLKIDTYSINTKMNDLIRKCNYNFVGEIYFLGREKPFFCYEKVL
ncbi:acetyltransferase [Clostridium sp. DMHC 10]|nr:GNAT family N-acetyltransferase [Clostridium sp. DMHC 10]KOF56550.1 acetyltransferase [Clostridium sp. DMHC 10]